MRQPKPDHNIPVLDDLDSELKTLNEADVEERFGWLKSWILPAFGVISALLGPWLVIGLLFLAFELFTQFFGKP